MTPPPSSIRCEACNRSQKLPGSGAPNALTLDECQIIGWAQMVAEVVDRGWLCPLHAPGGIGKLAGVVKKGLTE
jgi:hypothetical protein